MVAPGRRILASQGGKLDVEESDVALKRSLSHQDSQRAGVKLVQTKFRVQTYKVSIEFDMTFLPAISEKHNQQGCVFAFFCFNVFTGTQGKRRRERKDLSSALSLLSSSPSELSIPLLRVLSPLCSPLLSDYYGPPPPGLG